MLAFMLAAAAGGLAFYNHLHRLPRQEASVESVSPTVDTTSFRRRSPAPHVSLPPVQPDQSVATKTTNDSFVRMLKGLEPQKITVEQVATYLAANHRTAASLLGAFQATGDTNLLQEAKEKHGNNPAVAYTAFYKTQNPEERRQWLEALKRASPENGLANYLSAAEYLKAGKKDEALSELEAAHLKPQLEDYKLERIQATEEAYLAAGVSAAEAKTTATMFLELPQLAMLKGLTQQLVELSTSYRQSGDAASADAALQLGVELGQRLNTGQNTVIEDLVGMAVLKLTLSQMDPAAPYGSSGLTVKDKMEQLTQQRKEIKALVESTCI